MKPTNDIPTVLRACTLGITVLGGVCRGSATVLGGVRSGRATVRDGVCSGSATVRDGVRSGSATVTGSSPDASALGAARPQAEGTALFSVHTKTKSSADQVLEY